MPINKEADINTEMSEADDTKKDPSTDVGVGDADSTNQEASKTEPEKEPEQETPDVTNDTQEHAQTDDKIESEPTAEKIEEQKANKDITPVVSGPPINKEALETKIKENEELKNKLESAFSSQDTEKESYTKLTEDNATLQKHHDDMKTKFDEMEGTHVLLVAEVETLRKVSHEQKDMNSKLESEIKLLKETQGGDENIKDMQEKLIRMANEQEDKDKRIHSLEGELDVTREKLKATETRAVRGDSNSPQNSKTCILM